MWTTEMRRDVSVFEELAPWWNQCPGPRIYPYLRHDWFSLWASSFLGPGSQLEVILWKRDGELAAALPLWRKGLKSRSLSNAHSEVFDLVASSDPEVGVQVVRGLRRRPVTRFFRLDANSPLASASTSRWHVDRQVESLFVDLNDGIEAVWEGMSRNLRSNLRRNEHKLERMGEVVYLDNSDEALPDALDNCLDLEAAGWKGRNGTAIVSRDDTKLFYRGLADLAREKGWLRLGALLVADRLVAFEFSIDYAGRRFWLKSGYDEELAGSPGLVLKWRAIQEAVRLGLEAYELGGEAEDWKRQWARQTRSRMNVTALGSAGPGGIVGTALRPWIMRSAPAPLS